MPGLTLQDRLVNLCCQYLGVAGARMQRSEERRGTRQVALGLRDIRLECDDLHVVGCDIKNLVSLSQRLGETTLIPIGSRFRAEQGKVARVEPLGFVEIRLAPVPLDLASVRHRPAIWGYCCY